MLRRFISVQLIMILCLAAFCVTAMAVEGDPLFDPMDGQVDHIDTPDEEITIDPGVTEGDLRTSANGIQFIKEQEGFTSSPYKDVSQMSVGYGCSTVYADRYGYNTYPLSEEDAGQLLICVVAELEQKLCGFLSEYDIAVTQTEFDALISFTFNVGTSWLNPDYRLANLLIQDDYTVNAFASAMGVWCHVGEEIDKNLIYRRICEIKLFLYGAYDIDDTPNKFCYTIFNGNGGSAQTDIGFYLEDAPYGTLFTAEHDSLYFNGWYLESGEQITKDTIVTADHDDVTVHAKWGTTPMEEIPEDEPPVNEEPDNSSSYVEAADKFYDITANDWYYMYVNDLYNAGVIDGYAGGTFRPERTVTNGEALKMILLAAGYEKQNAAAYHWAGGYLELALEECILDEGDMTDLNAPISRGLMAKLVTNALGLSRMSTSDPFSDTSDYYICCLYDYGIADGYTDGTFKPAKSLKRVEIAAIVWRMNDIF